MRKSLIILLFILTLACNFPGFPDSLTGQSAIESSPEVPVETEKVVPETEEQEEIDEGETQEDEDIASPTLTSTPQATSTDAPPPEVEATATNTPTVTPTPTATEKPATAPTATKKPTATSTVTPKPQPGPPMSFLEPAWELVEWHKLGDTGEWEGTLRARITGGTPPYRSRFENNDFVTGLDMPVRWRLCKPMPATIRVVSADGQDIHTGIWVFEVGCP